MVERSWWVYLYNLVIFILMFFIYSFIGFLFEVILAFVKEHRLVNRGFLIGPVIPIWGVGVVFITLILSPNDTVFSLLISSAFIGTFLEYVVNYLMEKIFKARWWDYSDLPFNINGRIWLGSSMLFGVGGLTSIKYINPFLYNFINSFNPNFICILVSIFLILFFIDIIVSCNIIQNLKISVDNMRKDHTEEITSMVKDVFLKKYYSLEITKKIKSILNDKSKLFKRLLKAFPEVKFRKKEWFVIPFHMHRMIYLRWNLVRCCWLFFYFPFCCNNKNRYCFGSKQRFFDILLYLYS